MVTILSPAAYFHRLSCRLDSRYHIQSASNRLDRLQNAHEQRRHMLRRDNRKSPPLAYIYIQYSARTCSCFHLFNCFFPTGLTAWHPVVSGLAILIRLLFFLLDKDSSERATPTLNAMLCYEKDRLPTC